MTKRRRRRFQLTSKVESICRSLSRNHAGTAGPSWAVCPGTMIRFTLGVSFTGSLLGVPSSRRALADVGRWHGKRLHAADGVRARVNVVSVLAHEGCVGRKSRVPLEDRAI